MVALCAYPPRALARFQTLPDWYELPNKRTLAGKIIGNAMPCLGYQRIIESLIY
jgi:site-specific DNA-cytosine methylase